MSQIGAETMLDRLASLFSPLPTDIVEPTLELAVEIAREGREGHRIGTLFTLGDSEIVLQHSRPLILDPLVGHPEGTRHVTNPNLRGTIKELAQLDGAFVISEAGIFVAACRYLDAKAAKLELPFGLGTRHMAAAAMSKISSAIGVVVSETAIVRLFRNGLLTAEILPELWLLSRYASYLPGPIHREHIADLAVLTRES